MPEEPEPTETTAAQQANVIDMDALAQKIAALLRRELEIETERLGKLNKSR